MVTQEELDELLETGANQALAADRAADHPSPTRSPSSAGASSRKRGRRGSNSFRADRYTPSSDHDIDRTPRYDRERYGHNARRQPRERERSGEVEWREMPSSDNVRRDIRERESERSRSGDVELRETQRLFVVDRHGRQNVDIENRQFSEKDMSPSSGPENRKSRGSDAASRDGSNHGVRAANGRQRSRRRSRSPDRRRDGSREKNYRERDRHARGDFYSGDGRSHREDDRYRPGRYDKDPRDSDKDRGQARARDTARDADRDRRPRRDRGRYNEDNTQSGPSRSNRTPEPTDDERDRRTVFVQQLANRLRTRELHDFFEQVGPVHEAQIVKDRASGRSKGVGYVEFRDVESVQKAIQLTGQKLLGIPIIAQLTEAEKNRQAKTNTTTATLSNGAPFHRLYVGNIHFSITEEDLKTVFEPFGELEFTQLQKDETGRSKGYGFVQFIDPSQAKEALEKMNGFELAGRPIRVGLGNDKFTSETTQSLMPRFNDRNQQFQGSAFSGSGGRGAHAGGSGNFDRAGGDKSGGASALDDNDVAGVNFSNYSRDALMRKLARTDEPEQKIAPKTQQFKPMVVDEPAPSRCVVVKHMYDQSEETDPNWQNDLKLDVKVECEKQYGRVLHLDLALDSNDGEVYIKFHNIEGGQNAVRGLNGRYFAHRVLSAQFVVEAVYNMNFPKSANL